MNIQYRPSRRSKGFTLLELMIAVAIIGILASMALQTYSTYMRKAKLTDGTAYLADYRIKIEQYFQDNMKYGTAANAACGAPVEIGTNFTYSCLVGATTDTYTATATSKAGSGLGNTAGDFTFTITQANVRSTTKFAGATVTKTCWLIGGSEC